MNKTKVLAIGLTTAVATAHAQTVCSIESFTEEHRQSVYTPPKIDLGEIDDENSALLWQEILIHADRSDINFNQQCQEGDSCYGRSGELSYWKRSVYDAFRGLLATEGRREQITERERDDLGWQMAAIEIVECSSNTNTHALECRKSCTLWQED